MKSHRNQQRRCPVPLCGNAARHGHLLCRSCWGTVPTATQRAVNRAWNAMRKALQVRSDDLPELLREYRRASDTAIAAAERSRP